MPSGSWSVIPTMRSLLPWGTTEKDTAAGSPEAPETSGSVCGELAQSLRYTKPKLGADASAAAGPKGRTAEGATDIVMNAEILSYSRNKGLFAGISLEGSTLRSDGSANEKLYGRKLTAKEIMREGKVGIRPSAHELVSLLDRKSPVNKSDPRSLE